MKRFIALLIAVLMAISVLTGCSGKQAASEIPGDNAGAVHEEAYEHKESSDKVFKSTFSSPLKSMNPYCTESINDYKFIANIIEGLVESDKYGMPSPCMAESWESNDDFSVWTFHIRPDVYWVDCEGQKTEYKVTADDFVAGIRYIADPKNNARGVSTIRGVIAGLEDYYSNLTDIDGGEDIGMSREEAEAAFDETVGVKALDEYTVEYTTNGPCPYFLSYAQLDLTLPVEQEFLDSVGEDYGIARDKLLYNGGYYISEWDLDKQFIMNKNENYWDYDSLTLDTLEWEFISDSISNLEMFQRGNVTEVALSSEEIGSIRGSEWEKYIFLAGKNPTTYWYTFNFTTRNPEMAVAVQNENFRKAIFTAIDAMTISAIREPVHPEYFCRYTILPEDVMFDADGKDYTDYGRLPEYKGHDPFDPELAKEYMKKAVSEICEADGVTIKGAKAGKVDMLPITEFSVDGKLPIDIVFSTNSTDLNMKRATILKNMLEEYLGREYVNVILGFSNNSFSAEVYDLGNWDMLANSYGFRFADPSANLNRCTSDFDLTKSSYNIPEYDALVEEATGKSDISERYELYSQAECFLLDHAYIKPYMCDGGFYKMTYLEPYSTPGGYFGLGKYKMKGAFVQEEPVTAEQEEILRNDYEAERAKRVNTK
ncbi:MAG: peptide ABC transporter substrate-binding protein [Candidatus Limivicinus sp.]